MGDKCRGPARIYPETSQKDERSAWQLGAIDALEALDRVPACKDAILLDAGIAA